MPVPTASQNGELPFIKMTMRLPLADPPEIVSVDCEPQPADSPSTNRHATSRQRNPYLNMANSRLAGMRCAPAQQNNLRPLQTCRLGDPLARERGGHHALISAEIRADYGVVAPPSAGPGP